MSKRANSMAIERTVTNTDRNTNPVCINFTASQRQFLGEVAATLGVSVSHLVRGAVDKLRKFDSPTAIAAELAIAEWERQQKNAQPAKVQP